MVVTAAAHPQFARPLSAAPEQAPPGSPPVEEPMDRLEIASSVAGAAVLGAGVGWLGIEAGGRAGFMIGMMLTPPGVGLGGLVQYTLEGARIGIIAGGLLGIAAGVTLGAVVGSELYRAYQAHQQG